MIAPAVAAALHAHPGDAVLALHALRLLYALHPAVRRRWHDRRSALSRALGTLRHSKQVAA